MTKRKGKTNAEKTEEALAFSAKVLEFGREQGREEMRNSKECPDDCCAGSHAKWIDEVGKSMVLDEICDPEPLSGYTLLDEMEFTLYSASAELNRLQKLILLYKEQQGQVMSADYSDEPSCTRRGTGWIDFSILEKKPRKRVKIKKRNKNEM